MHALPGRRTLGATGAGRWGRRLVVAVFVVQFLVPLLALVGSPAPSKFGFQMYSGVGGLSAEVIGLSGDREHVDIGSVLAAGRPDIDWLSRLPDHLCAVRPGAAEVVVRQAYPDGDRVVRQPCSRP